MNTRHIICRLQRRHILYYSGYEYDFDTKENKINNFYFYLRICVEYSLQEALHPSMESENSHGSPYWIETLELCCDHHLSYMKSHLIIHTGVKA